MSEYNNKKRFNKLCDSFNYVRGCYMSNSEKYSEALVESALAIVEAEKSNYECKQDLFSTKDELIALRDLFANEVKRIESPVAFPENQVHFGKTERIKLISGLSRAIFGTEKLMAKLK